jgi:hypothetical protein
MPVAGPLRIAVRHRVDLVRPTCGGDDLMTVDVDAVVMAATEQRAVADG